MSKSFCCLSFLSTADLYPLSGAEKLQSDEVRVFRGGGMRFYPGRRAAERDFNVYLDREL